MGVQDAQDMAQALLREHKLDAWSFKFDGATRRFGYCDYRNRVISVSKPLSELNTEERVKNTILHEIAHALTPGAKHTLRWKLAALKIGSDGEARYDGKVVVLPPTKFRYKYEAVCERCGLRIPKKMYRRGLACRRCCEELNYGCYSLQYQFKWETI